MTLAYEYTMHATFLHALSANLFPASAPLVCSTLAGFMLS